MMNRKQARYVLAPVVSANVLVYILSRLYPEFAHNWWLISGDASGNYLPSLATYSFVHSGILHLVFNMIVLWCCGERLLQCGGWKRFLAAYFAGGIAGGLGFLVISDIMGDGVLSLCGASAAVLGVAGGLWPYYKNRKVSIPDFIRFISVKSAEKFVITVRGRYLLAAILLMTVVGNPLPAAVVTHCCGFVAGISGVFISNLRGRRGAHAPVSYLSCDETQTLAPEEIFEKVRISGYDSLTSDERQKLKI